MNTLSTLFGCQHASLSFPLTPTTGPRRSQCYVCCLTCGAEFAYDPVQFRRGERITERRSETRARVAVEA